MILVFFPGHKVTNQKIKWSLEYGSIAIIWLLGAICDRIWFALDVAVPAWDQADYLNGAANYWHALQTPEFLDLDWWHSFWLLSNKIPPLHYILTAPFLSSGNLSGDRASWVMLGYSALLLVAVYGLGKSLFNSQVGIWAALICQLLPGLYYYRLEFLLDYPLTAIVIGCYWLLTLWHFREKPTWLLTIFLGISGGLSLLLKQTALFFLILPLLWSLINCLKNRHWRKLCQGIGTILIAIAICYPWYRTNWLLILTSSKRATVDSAIIEGDPALNTLDAWLYYLKTLPYLLSWVLLVVPLVGLLLYGLSKLFKWQFYRPGGLTTEQGNSIRWLSIYLVSGYLLSSLNVNKDARYILPLLPVIAIFLAFGLTAFSQRWQKYLVPGCFGLGLLLMLLNMFPLPGGIVATVLSPKVQHHPYTGQPYPHREIVQTIVETEPYLRHTLGVLPSTPQVNQHNFSWYGAGNSFQVVGRQVGVRENEIDADVRSLSWFLTKTGDQGSVPEAQIKITDLVRNSPDFQLVKAWDNPDNSQLQLFRANQPPVEVIKLEANDNSQVQLTSSLIYPEATADSTILAQFIWQGAASQLAKGIVLFSWYPVDDSEQLAWVRDRGIAFGMLAENLRQDNSTLQVTENTALVIPPDVPPGKYQLRAAYLNRETQESYPLEISPTILSVIPNAPVISAPELDLAAQLMKIAPTMASGINALEGIFAQTTRINQYDGKQDYLQQAEIALTHRLENNQGNPPQQKDWLYTIALSQVLQQDVQGAISTWQKITKLQPDNPYAYAYLAFVRLYNWQPKLAQQALERAEQIKPNIPEVKTLRGVAAIMQGRFISAWRLLT